jgi:hypothetical protein
MPVGVLIDPHAIYDDASLYETLDVGAATLSKARASGQLRFTRKGQRTFYLGQWVLDWLTADHKRTGPAPRQGEEAEQ